MIATRARLGARVRTMTKIGIHMMFHDKAKFVGTLFGVVFAVVLSNQQGGTFLGLMQKNVMLIEHAGADLWIVPVATQSIQTAGAQTLNTAALMQARTTRGVAWAEPLLIGGANVTLPGGGSQPIQIIGTALPACRGGPWNLVVGSCKDLGRPDTIVVEHGERRNLGGLNLGSVREINGRNMTVVGITWGLMPFGPSYSFTDFETARELIHRPRDQVNLVIVGLEPSADLAVVERALGARVPEAKVMTNRAFERATIGEVLTRTAIGITLGSSTLFGLLVGFVIVGLSMFSAVVDNVREFGTLKAIGCTEGDLALLLLVQSVVYALIGSLLGLTLVTRLALSIRSPKLALVMPSWLTLGTVGVMVAMCTCASMLALMRVRKVEPAMVFR